SLKLRFVEGHVLDADGTLVAIHRDDAVDHQERVAMRQRIEDLKDPGSFEGFTIHSSGPSSCFAKAVPPRRASRRSADTPRIQSRVGSAGVPPYFLPAGTSHATPELAAIEAPVPIFRLSA